MPGAPQQIDFDRFARDLGRILDEVRRLDRPILVERDGELYRVERVDRSDGLFAHYNPVRAQEALQASAGALREVDRDALLSDIHAEREQDSTGRPA